MERKSRAAPRSDDEEEPVPPPVIKNPRKQSSDPPADDKDQVYTILLGASHSKSLEFLLVLLTQDGGTNFKALTVFLFPKIPIFRLL